MAGEANFLSNWSRCIGQRLFFQNQLTTFQRFSCHQIPVLCLFIFFISIRLYQNIFYIQYKGSANICQIVSHDQIIVKISEAMNAKPLFLSRLNHVLNVSMINQLN